ncbi:LysR family transcriptional regulator [Ruania halotolerans]|uniref:LysR family transcriptional regulator n=1 Tax=Ruania halotolerans TaxID=2897773 RepID=UPI001E3189A2|nr:LysR family transcriptional regulator [Ruania halotolerans]UFU08177.1 LysR family transcriptional regulator [Ruania halotolerans]
MTFETSTLALRVLRSVAETGSFTAAADALGYTQSAVSKQIRALEGAVGALLCERGARGVRMTQAGAILASRGTSALDQLDAAQRAVRDLGNALTGTVALGGFPTTAVCLVPRTIGRIAREHPQISVEFTEAGTPAQMRRLRAGRLNLAIIAVGEGLPDYDLEGVSTEPLTGGRLRVAVPEGHRFSSLEVVPVSELVNEIWIGGHGAQGHPQFGAWPTIANPTVALKTADWTSRLGFVAAGIGITTIPALAAAAVPAGVITIPVQDSRAHQREMRLAWVGELSTASQAVQEALHLEAKKIGSQ